MASATDPIFYGIHEQCTTGQARKSEQKRRRTAVLPYHLVILPFSPLTPTAIAIASNATFWFESMTSRR
jgi:hypothetical protein